MTRLVPVMREYYGDEVRWFFGKVVDVNSPPGMEGMIKVRIHGIHSPDVNDIPQSDLPWAFVIVPATEPGISGLGKMPQIMPGAMVFGVFVDGKNSQVPMVLGSLPHTELPNTVQSEGRSDIVLKAFSYDNNKQKFEFIPAEEPETTPETPPAVSLQQARTLIVKFFIDNGFTVEQAAGMTGVLEVVSQFNPEKSSETTGFGIAQWPTTSPRWKKLLDFSSSLGNTGDWTTLNTQLLFILQELRSSHRTAAGLISKSNLMKDTKYPNSIQGASSTALFIKHYLPEEIKYWTSVTQSEQAAQLAYNIAIK